MAIFNRPKPRIYLDYAAATPLDPNVGEIMFPYFSERFANPSALYADAVKTRYVVDMARGRVAESIDAQPDQIVFTSGGTESNNMAILGITRKHVASGNHVIIGKTEHSSIIEAAKQLEKEGFDVEYVMGPREALRAVREDTILVSMMYVNNEIGEIYDIGDIGRGILKWRKKNKTEFPYFHTDACQAINYIDTRVDALHVDLLTCNAGKIYGPKGVGILYIRKGVELEPLLHGGGQEHGLRSGTESVPLVVGIGIAMAQAVLRREDESERLQHLQSEFWQGIQTEVPSAILNGPEIGDERIVNNLNISFPGVEGEQMVLYLDAAGVSCSTGSACSENSGKPSHVLTAMGYDDARVESSVRFTLGYWSNQKEIKRAIGIISRTYKQLVNAHES